MAKLDETTKRWTDEANKQLKGKTIASVRYLTNEECKHMMWYKRCPVIVFTDGSMILPQADDEGNDSGVIFGINKDGQFILPSLYGH